MIVDGMRVHDESTCKPPCPFHSPSDHPLKDAPMHIRVDKDFLVERICPHGIGHDDPDSVAYMQEQGFSWAGVHGCDGCCTSTNKQLDLPVDSMKRVVIAFDVDGTVRNNTSDDIVANERIRTLLITLASFKNTKIVLWSGSGELYARQVAKELGLNSYIDEFASKTEWLEIKADIAIDDIQDTAIGGINLIVREK